MKTKLHAVIVRAARKVRDYLDGWLACPACDGAGMILKPRKKPTPCAACNGSGEIIR
jgi:DnaJ-class molecular chaperone